MTAQEIELIRQLLEKVNRLERRIGLADTLELASGGGVYTNEEAQDAVGTILTDTATIDFTYTDATPSITADVKTDSITFAKMQNIATDSLIGRDTASTGDPENILLNATLSMDGAGNLQRAALTGDVTASAGSNTTAIGASKVLTAMIADAQVTLAKMANLAQATIIGRASGAGTGVPTALTAAQVVAIIQSSIDHGGIGGLSDDDHAQYALLAGRSGGQSLSGGTAANDDLTLQGTTNATRTTSYVLIQPNGGNTAVGSAITTPAGVLHAGAIAFTDTVLFERAGQTLDVFVASMRLLVTKTTNMADGFGPAITLAIRDDAGVINAIGAVGAIRAGGDTTGDVVLAPVVAGTTTQTVWARATGGIEVLQPTLGGVVQKLYSTATNDDPSELFYQNRVTTTDATVTTLHTFTVPTSTSYMVEVVVIARRTGGIAGAAEDGAGYKLLGLYKNTAGTVAIIGAVVQTVVGESQAGWDATLDTTGATVRVRVTGAANNNVTWHVGGARVWQVAS